MAKTAIDAPRRSFFMVSPSVPVVIGYDTKDGPEHPLYDPRILLPLDPSLLINIARNGVLAPTKVRKNGEAIETVDGRRRILHARVVEQAQLGQIRDFDQYGDAAEVLRSLAGTDPLLIPVEVTTGTDADLFSVSRTLNAYRVNDGPMTNATNAKRLLDMGKSRAEVGLAFGVSDQAIANWIQLLDLAPEVQQAMRDAELTPTAALHLAELTRSEQVEVVTEIKEENRTNGKRATASAVKAKAGKRKGKDTSSAATPKERIKKAEGIYLSSIVGKESQTKEEIWAVLNRLARALFSKGIDKLAPSED